MRDEIERYRAASVRPFGVNPAERGSHAGYAARLRLPFPLLADEGGGVARAYRAVQRDGARVIRTVYLIDRGGIVRFAARGSPSAATILACLEQEPEED